MLPRVKFTALWFVIAALLVLPAAAQEKPTPISAMTAYDAYISQTDPDTGRPANIVLLDVRTRAEYFWIGAAAMVESIEVEGGNVLYPDDGKVRLIFGGRMLKFEVRGHHAFIRVSEVADVTLKPIGHLIPFKNWDPVTGEFTLNETFTEEVEALADPNRENIVIFFCRSGGRSEACALELTSSLYSKQYEIDQPDGKSGRGGFQGSTYGDVYIGYRGFPGRATRFQSHESVSWSDIGLPIKIGAPLP